MDHLHQNTGCPQLFIIATGDQDFVPLVERILDERADVVLIAGSLADLSNEYRSIVSQQHVKMIGLIEDENVPLLPTSKDADERAIGVAALVRLLVDGGVLGGDQTSNVSRVSSWRGLGGQGSEDQRLQAWIQESTGSEIRRVAVPGTRASGNKSAMRRRVFLDLGKPGVDQVVRDLDWILRRCESGRTPQTVGTLGVGRFAADDGSRVASSVKALVRVGWLIERPDGTLENAFPWGTDGFIEPLMRVLSVVQHASYEAKAPGVDREQVFGALRSQPIAGSPERRGGSFARDAIDFGRRFGVIDSFPYGRDGYVLGAVAGHPLVRQLSDGVRLLKSSLPAGEWVPEASLLESIRDLDRDSSAPVFGFDTRDRRSMLRALGRARITDRKHVEGEFRLKLRGSTWLEGL